ncbi:radical SAM protein [bacterium]|nr:radical SAM protein [bacterium]
MNSLAIEKVVETSTSLSYTQEAGALARHNLATVKTGAGSLFFDKVSIFLNRGCNLQCRGCYVKAMPERQPSLELAEIREIILFGRSRGARYLVIPGFGEPFLDERIWPTIEFARENGLQSVIYSNGTMIDRLAAQRCRALGVTLLLKRNSFNHKLQDYWAGINGASRLMEKGLHNLLAAGYQAPELALESYVVRPLLDELKEVLRFCRRHNLLPYFEAFENSSPEIAGEIGAELLSDQELTDFFDQLAAIDRNEFGLDVIIPEGARIYSFAAGLPQSSPVFRLDQKICCDRSFTTFSVAHTGAVRLCVDHRKEVGNIHSESLETIFDPLKNHRLSEFFRRPCSYQTAHYCGVS